jgi:hypothetical protein
MLATILLALLASLALLAWLHTVFHWVRAMRHRRPEVSLGRLLLNGMAAFDESNFSEAGQPHVRAMRRGFVAFFACILLAVVVVAVSLAQRGDAPEGSLQRPPATRSTAPLTLLAWSESHRVHRAQEAVD